jgi:hypothetical protein
LDGRLRYGSRILEQIIEEINERIDELEEIASRADLRYLSGQAAWLNYHAAWCRYRELQADIVRRIVTEDSHLCRSGFELAHGLSSPPRVLFQFIHALLQGVRQVDEVGNTIVLFDSPEIGELVRPICEYCRYPGPLPGLKVVDRVGKKVVLLTEFFNAFGSKSKITN